MSHSPFKVMKVVYHIIGRNQEEEEELSDWQGKISRSRGNKRGSLTTERNDEFDSTIKS